MNHAFALHPSSLVILSVILIALLAACGTAVTPPAPITLRIAGSTSMLPLLSDLTTAYAKEYPYIRFTIEGGDSHVGLERLERGKIDLAACSWLPAAEEGTPWPYIATPVAWDGIALIVHPDNPVRGLTLLQLRNIYAGWTLDWQEVGGQPGDILVVSREDGSGTRAVFERQVMGEQPVTLTAIVMPSSSAVVEYVTRHTAAIGYVSMSYTDQRGLQNPLRPVKVLRIEGAYPTPETVRNGVYHLIRPLYLVTRGEPSGEVRTFIEFVLGPAGQAIVSQRYGRIHE